MPLLGAHMSIAGGYYKAVEAAAKCGMDTCQIFSKNNNQWRGKEITAQDAERFQAALKSLGITRPIIHDSYLINLASPDDALWEKSIDAFVLELERADLLGVSAVVTHPGAYTSGTEVAGIARVILALDEVHRRAPNAIAMTLLETTAGQGTALGWRFEQLGTMLNGVATPRRLGVCVDTCHIHAAGYPLATTDEYQATMAELDQSVGLANVRAFHLNDSKKPLGSRVDRHERIGAGSLGLEPFRHLLNDPRFANVPMYMETPKGEENGEDLDVVNLATLRGLIR